MEKQKTKQKGITLIALVISIIVMLILAGVSLNMTIGENGIISQAQNATYLQSCADLSEYLNTEYAKIAIDDILDANGDGENSPIEVLVSNSKTDKYFYIPKYEHIGNLMYIVDAEGKALYLIKKSNLPDDIKANIHGGEAGEGSYTDYYSLNDVYGVTENLKVYYCSNGKSSMINVSPEDLDDDNPYRVAMGSDSALKDLISVYDKDGDGCLNAKEVKNIDSLTVDSTLNISDLNELYKLPSLKRLIIKDKTLENLQGLEYVPYLEYLEFDNCNISDYTQVNKLLKLNELYFKNSNQTQFEGLMDAMAGVEYRNLNQIYITNNSITDMSKMANLHSSTKLAVKRLNLSSNNITSDSSFQYPGISVLKDFVNVTKLQVNSNNNLKSLKGVGSMDNLVELYANSCGLGGDEVYNETLENKGKNPNTDALAELSKLSKTKKLNTVYLQNNTNLKWIDYINIKPSYGDLCLKGCPNLVVSSVALIADTYNKSSWRQIDAKYNKYLSSSDFIKYDNLGLTDTSDEILGLEGMTSENKLKVKVIDLSGNEDLTDEKINSLLSSGFTNLYSIRLTSCKKLKTLNFLQYTPNIKELLIRGTSIGVAKSSSESDIATAKENAKTELSKIDTYCHAIKSLEYNGTYGEANDIKEMIKRCAHGLESSVYYANHYNRLYCLESIQAGLSNIDYYPDNFRLLNLGYSYNGGILDLSGTRIRTFQAIDSYYIYPSTVTSLGDIIWENGDISRCVNLRGLGFNPNAGTYTGTYNFFKQVYDNNLNNISYANVYYYSEKLPDFKNNFDYLKKANLTSISILDYKWKAGLVEKPAKIAKVVLNLNDNPETDYVEFEDLTSLNLSGIQNFDTSGLTDCTSLASINLQYCDVQSLSDFTKLQNLTNLNLRYNSVANLSDLNLLKTSLVTLDLRNNNLDDSDIDYLVDLNKNGVLRNLYIGENPGITNVGISKLKNSGLTWEDVDF